MKFNPYLFLGIAAVVLVFAVIMAQPVQPEKKTVTRTFEPVDRGFSEAYLSARTLGESGDAPYVIKLKTNKYSYHSDEKLNMNVSIDAPARLDSAEVSVFGVMNKYGSYKIRESAGVNLSTGKNDVVMEEEIPSCYGCSGIEPGKYNLTVGLRLENGTEIANASVEIEILK